MSTILNGFHWRNFFVPLAGAVVRRTPGSALDGNRASVDLNDDPVPLGSVTLCSVVDVYRVVAFVKCEVKVVLQDPHPESQFTAGVLE